MTHRPHPKQHATCPRDVRERRHRHAKLDRAAKLASRQSRAEAERTGLTRIEAPPEYEIVDELHIWAPGWERIVGAILARRT